MSPRDPAYLADILRAAQNILYFTGNMDQSWFLDDDLVRSSVIRDLEVIGEATKRLSDEIRSANPQIPWRKMAGMRDILIHGYDDLDMLEVWRAATVGIPELISRIEPLLGDPAGH